jgi:hypothetical protein
VGGIFRLKAQMKTNVFLVIMECTKCLSKNGERLNSKAYLKVLGVESPQENVKAASDGEARHCMYRGLMSCHSGLGEWLLE